MIPYGRQSIGPEDIEAVLAVLQSQWLTQGPVVEEFERALAAYAGARYAVVMNSGTSALHAAFVAAGLRPGDEFITTPITFPATANAGLWQGAKPVFVDVDSNGNLDPDCVEAKITSRTKAIVPVDYTGRPAGLDAMQALATKHRLVVIEDACQALGGSYKGKKIGAVSDFTAFSLHPVKSITSAEGGAVLTNNETWYRIMKKFVTHGVTKEDFVHPSPGEWYFEQQLLGLNYRLTDLQAALGLSQLRRLDTFIEKRRQLSARYTQAFAGLPGLRTPAPDTEQVRSAWHLYVLQFTGPLASRRGDIFRALRAKGIGAQVHHIPVHYHPYYERLGYARGATPKAEDWYESIISLPLYPDLTEEDQDKVITAVKESI